MTYKTTLDAISNLGPDFQQEAQHCAETLRHIDEALDRAKKDKRNAAARGRSAALRGAGLKRTADGWV